MFSNLEYVVTRIDRRFAGLVSAILVGASPLLYCVHYQWLWIARPLVQGVSMGIQRIVPLSPAMPMHSMQLPRPKRDGLNSD
ncbi:hypothetical protein VNO77_22640 [Canavalia gladiata]|uniref:Uncharacterized protein n=1 Tax=Canavalia gladiata TaxID=3824 RepID=A0AAN9L3X8_CANGL